MGCYYACISTYNKNDLFVNYQDSGSLTINFYLPGFQHLCKVMLCRCEDPANTLLRYNLWPATPTSPKVAFDVRFMEMLSVLQLECHLPAKTFCEALGCMRFNHVNLASSFVSNHIVFWGFYAPEMKFGGI